MTATPNAAGGEDPTDRGPVDPKPADRSPAAEKPSDREPAGAGARRALAIAAVVEPASLLVLLVNLGTAHVPAVAAALGPVHGTAYLITIVLAWAGNYPRRARLLTLVPGLGGALALRATSGRPS